MAAAKAEGKLSLASHVKGGLKQSWADQEAENEPVSIAPVSKPVAPNPNKFEKRGRPEADERPAPRDDGPRRGGHGGARGGGRAGEGKPQAKPQPQQQQQQQAKVERPKLPVPEQAPWRAYIGNLSLDVMEDQVRKFFDGCNVTHLNLVTRGDGSFKGYGFVEFGDKKSLENALLLNEMSLDGKPIKIDVASPDQGEPKAPSTRGGRGGGRGGGMGRPVAYQRGTAHGPGSERFNREDAEVQTKKPAAAEPVNVAPLPKHEDGPAPAGGGGYKRLALKKKGEAAPTAAASVTTAASATAAKPAKKSNPFGDAKPREANLMAAHKEDKFVEKAPTEEEWNQRLEEEDKHKRRRHHEDEDDEHQSRAAQSHGHGHGHGHTAPAKGTPNAGGAAAPAPAAAATKAKAAAPKSPALGAAATPAPAAAAAAPAPAAAKKSGGGKAPWANAQGTGAVSQAPSHAVVIKDGPTANPAGAPAAVIPAKPAAAWGGNKAAAKPAAAAAAAPAAAPAPAAAAPAKAATKAAPPPGMAATPAPVAVPAAAPAAAPAATSPTADDRSNWGRDGSDKQRRVWNDAAEARPRGGARGGARGGRGRGAAGTRGGRGGAAPRRAEPVAAAKAPADAGKDGAAKPAAKKAPAAPDAAAAEPEVGNQFSVLGDDDDAGADAPAGDE